ncbi:MAG: hypothetical protein QOG99_1668 [Frankiales bacterium]|nr:hypothetical protein [Frankiales bacterium]
MDNNSNRISTGTSAWAPLTMSPKRTHQGSGLPFAGYASVATMAPAAPTALRTADAKVPDPRGRTR